MPTLLYSVTISGMGIVIQQLISRSADSGVPPVEIVLPPGDAGTLSTRSGDDAGELTLADGHGITTGAIVDLYWEGGRRYGVEAGTVAGNDVPIEGGAGDNLPAEDAAIVAAAQVPFNTLIDGDELSLIALCARSARRLESWPAHVTFADADEDEITAVDLVTNEPRVYDIAGGDDNPFTGDPITTGHASNGSTSEEITLQIVGLVDATPS